MEPDWEDIRIFLAVARHQSLSAAGKALKRDAATIGRRIARLERATGARLFAKSPQGYAITDSGLRLLGHVEAADHAMTAGIDGLTGEGGRLSGQVRVGATDGCATFILPQVCAAISREHPELELQIVALPRVISLSKREADLAITVSPPQAGRLHVQKITDYHLHLAASRKYLTISKPITHVQDLNAHPFVGYIQDMLSYSELDFLTELGIERPALSSNLVSVQLGCLREQGGLGVTHDFIFPSAPDIAPVLREEIAFKRSFYLLRHTADLRVERFTRVAEALVSGIRTEVMRLEAMLDTMG